MADYKIGYGKPPKGRPFEPGRSGNPNGRPKRTPDPLSEAVEGVLDAEVTYSVNGRTKNLTQQELSLTVLVRRALQGNVAAAVLVLKKRRQAQRQGQGEHRRLVVHNSLPEPNALPLKDGPRGAASSEGSKPQASPENLSQDSSTGQPGSAEPGRG